MLEVENLEVCYKDQAPALQGLSFSLHKGEAIGVVGRSGAGKTTLLKAILRILPRDARVNSGKILYQGNDIFKLSEKKFNGLRGKAIGMLPQNAQASLNPFLKILNFIAEGIRRHRGIGGKEAKALGLKLIELVGLEPALSSAYPAQLSGGMRTRTALAALLACGPDYILLDEPTSGLDIIAQDNLAELFNKIRKIEGVGMLIVSHELPFIWQICDRIIILDRGNMAEEIKKDHPGFLSKQAGKFLESIPKIDGRSLLAEGK